MFMHDITPPHIHQMDTKDCPKCDDGTLWPLQEGGHEGLIKMECDSCDYEISQHSQNEN